jgi:hypothetical protein
MDQKSKLTKIVLDTLEIDSTPKSIKKHIPIWFRNPRKKEKGGLRLTEEGFSQLVRADIKFYTIKIEETFEFNNQLLIWIDNNLDCPFYISQKKIFVFGEKLAVQLALLSGDLQKLRRAKIRFQQKVLDC